MGRAPCCSKVGLHRGPWTPREDTLLTKYIQTHGEGHWRSLPKKAGLLRCGKSCRLRWMNYLRPDIKRGNITPDEEDLIIRLHALLGNRWSLIAGRLPGRTDNEIKNYWNTHLSKRLRNQGTDPNTHKKLSDSVVQEAKNKRRNARNTNNSRKKQSHNKSTKAFVEPEKHKVHLPKPIRVTSFVLPRNGSFDCENLYAAALSQDREKDLGADVPYCSFKDGDDNGAGFLVSSHDHRDYLVNALDFECQSHLFTDENSFSKLYEEYLQILKSEDDQVHELDSFAESFLVE